MDENANTPYKETEMLDKITKSLEPFQEFFDSKFDQDNEEAVVGIAKPPFRVPGRLKAHKQAHAGLSLLISRRAISMALIAELTNFPPRKNTPRSIICQMCSMRMGFLKLETNHRIP
jgi:hypothetical protein